MGNERELPDEFFRGISSKEYIVNGTVTTEAFQFSKEPRTDGYKDLSVNWNDDDGALVTILNQEKEKQEGTKQFKGGAAKINRNKANLILKQHILEGNFGYERDELEGNLFHGNLLLKGTTDKRIAKMIIHSLGLLVDEVFPQSQATSD